MVAYGRWSLTRGGRTWRLACNRVLQERVITLSPTPILEARGLTLRLVSTLQRFWHEWLYPPLMNVIPSPKYHECEYTLFVPAIRDPYLVGLLNRLNDCVTLKYQHIV